MGTPPPPDARPNAIRVHRRALQLTQAQLAQACSVSRQTIVSAEAGDYAPSVYLALRMADALETTVEALFAPRPAPPDAAEAGTHHRSQPQEVPR